MDKATLGHLINGNCFIVRRQYDTFKYAVLKSITRI